MTRYFHPPSSPCSQVICKVKCLGDSMVSPELAYGELMIGLGCLTAPGSDNWCRGCLKQEQSIVFGTTSTWTQARSMILEEWPWPVTQTLSNLQFLKGKWWYHSTGSLWGLNEIMHQMLDQPVIWQALINGSYISVSIPGTYLLRVQVNLSEYPLLWTKQGR